MTDDDDNLLRDYDLSAWGAPPAPANLADGVIARVTATDEAIAAMKQRGSKRRWWLIGGVAASVAVVTLGVWIGVRATTGEPAPGAGSGTVIADRAQRIELGASSANVDAGARVSWTRDGSTLRVTQDAGTATWNVGPKDSLVLTTATGAAVEAAGGSLRVEVRMNAMDVRVIGASAATAAAVALVTVIVYEGHVKVTSAQQTMVVVPGTTVEVAAGKPPREVSNVGLAPVQPLPLEPAPGTDVVLPAGEIVTIHDPRGTPVVRIVDTHCTGKQVVTTDPELRPDATGTFALDSDHYLYELMCDGRPVSVGTIEVVRDPGTAPEQVAAILAPIDGAAWTSPVHVSGAAMTGATVSVSGRGILVDGADHGFAGDVDPGAATTLAVRVEHPQHGIHYFLRRKGTGDHDKTVAQKPPSPPPACDQDALLKIAEVSVTKGEHAKALAQYEVALHCKSDSHTLQLAFMESCNSENIDKARVYWKQLSPTTRDRALMICVRNKITREMLDGGASSPAPACDQKELLKKAEYSVALGNHAQALTQYEEALACKSDLHTLQLTFMEACNSENVDKARVYWKKLSPELQNRAVSICTRNKISTEMLEGTANTPAPACDAKHLLEIAEGSVALGNHGQALKQYEDALRCKSDSQTLQMAFMEACNSANVTRAKLYWKKLPVEVQNRALQICVRQKISREQLEGP